MYAEKQDFTNASKLFREILDYVLNFSREKYIFRDLLCLGLQRKWDEMDTARLNYIESYPAFMDSPSDEFIKSIYSARSDLETVNELISSSRPGFVPSWAFKGV